MFIAFDKKKRKKRNVYALKISDPVVGFGLRYIRFIPEGDWLHSHGLDQEHSSALRSS